MRAAPLFLLLSLCTAPLAFAEEVPPQPLAEVTSMQAQIDELEQRLAISEQQREALGAELQSSASERENVQLQRLRLRQDNQRLKLELKKAQSSIAPAFISEQQMWFAIGAGAGLLGVIIGALLRRGRRSQSEWLN
ncbi:MAG: translation initiation factor 2 [Pseudomonadaceae bacterium]|nr:translation initiation factor 2 [Pseudomonadaceae bacterium]